MLIVDRDNRILYELYRAHWNAGLNRWEAGSGAVFPLTSNLRRPDGWTSADAAGLAILPGLVRYDEAFGTDPIRHAFRVTVRDDQRLRLPGLAPRRQQHRRAADGRAPAAEGEREHLGLSRGRSSAIFQAMKTYGLIVADNGSDMYITGIVRSALGSADGRLRAGLPRPPRQPVRGGAAGLDAAGHRRRRRRRPARRLGDDASASIPTARPASNGAAAIPTATA